ncbi:MAG: CHAD domain-containing protein [Actinomycetota bacterium]|nr:CHAD domain-containing protein [Actinomycetota bacterium]
MTSELEGTYDPPVDVSRPHPGKPVARVLHAYLVAQLDQLLAADGAVRRHEPDGIHDLRVALRRLRTTLATYRCLVDRAVTDPLRDEMRWVSHTLGTARDAEVVQGRLQELLAQEPHDVVLGPARSVLIGATRADAREARRVADETLRSQRYLAVIDQLHHLVSDPPWTDAAGKQAHKALPKLLAKDLRRLRRRVRQVDEADSPGERTRRLHDVRKAAKRLRYACEAAGSATNAADLEGAAKQVQTVLGDHHDTVLTRDRLLELAATETCVSTFTLDRLHAREETEAARLERAFADAWDDLEEAARATASSAQPVAAFESGDPTPGR